MSREVSLDSFNYPELLTALEMSCWRHLVVPVTRWKAKQVEAGLISPPILGPLVVFGEADGESPAGQLAVTQVILNRAVMRDEDHVDKALLQPKQFSCLNVNDQSLWRVNSVTTARVKELTINFQQAVGAFEIGELQSEVGNATFYMTSRCWEAVAMSWARGSGTWDLHKMVPRGQVGRHVFFAEC